MLKESLVYIIPWNICPWNEQKFLRRSTNWYIYLILPIL